MTTSSYDRAFAAGASLGTPLYCYDRDRLAGALAQFGEFTSFLALPADVYYSYKTNYLPALCGDLAAFGVGAEVTSAAEWRQARRLHAPGRIVVNGIGKCAGHLSLVLGDAEPPALINLETDTEVEQVCASTMGSPVPVGLRVRIAGLTGERGSDPTETIARGTPKFGWPADGDAVIAVAEKLAASPAVHLQALHLHLGGQLVSAETYRAALEGLCALADRLRARGIRISSIDLGGGLASGWVEKTRSGPLLRLNRVLGLNVPAQIQRGPDLTGIAAVINAFAPRLQRTGISQLIFEPGRFLAEPALMVVAKVIATRADDDGDLAVINAGVNLLHCWRSDERRPIEFARIEPGPQTAYRLVGPLCHRDDQFGTVRVPGRLRPGSLVCLDAIGAYSFGDWVANAWSRPAVVDLNTQRIIHGTLAPLDDPVEAAR